MLNCVKLSLGWLAGWAIVVSCQGAELHIGAATVSITPDKPVALSGQMRTRISSKVESPVMAVALALESREGEESRDQAIFVACDLVAIREGLIERVRERLKTLAPQFDGGKLVLSATHTHTAPVMLEGRYEIPTTGVMQPAEYADFLVEQVAKAAAEAWNARAPGYAGWGLGHAVVAQNRRAVYANGTAQMYGKSNRPDFRGYEGQEDHAVEVLCFWDQHKKLIATAVNVACPAQEVESLSAVNADFWHQARSLLQEKHGQTLHVLAWTGSAGDQSPHLQFRKKAEDRMRELRGLTRLEEIARRIVAAWEEAHEGAAKEMHADPQLQHRVSMIDLPPREISQEESLKAQQLVSELSKDPAQKTRMLWHQRVVDRFQKQQAGEDPPYRMELHTVRLGEVAIATNAFELYTDYGIQMKARSPALQTFLIQLAGPGSYLPTVRAAQGGGYSAIAESNLVGPAGGQVLVEQTVSAIESLWAPPTKPQTQNQ